MGKQEMFQGGPEKIKAVEMSNEEWKQLHHQYEAFGEPVKLPGNLGEPDAVWEPLTLSDQAVKILKAKGIEENSGWIPVVIDGKQRAIMSTHLHEIGELISDPERLEGDNKKYENWLRGQP